MQVLITDPIGDIGTKILKDAGLKIVEIIGASTDDLNKVLPKTDGWIVRSGTTVTRELMEAETSQEIPQTTGSTGEISEKEEAIWYVNF